MRAEGLAEVPDRLDRESARSDLWRAPDLLLSQTCGYPLMYDFKNYLQLIATPIYRCPKDHQGPSYRSLFLVRQEDPADRLEDLRGRTAVVNGLDSQSGYSALRHAVAPLARRGRFFDQVVVSGAHQASMAAVGRGEADICAIDSVTFRLTERAAPAEVAGLRILARSAEAPALPYITRKSASADMVSRLRAAVLKAAADPDLQAGPRRPLARRPCGLAAGSLPPHGRDGGRGDRLRLSDRSVSQNCASRKPQTGETTFMSELCDRSAVELRAMIARGDLAPVELLDSCIARTEAVNPVLNAVVATDYERARAAAKRAGDAVARGDALGLLHGLPVGIKDLNDTAGLRTTYGSQIFAEHVPESDDSVVTAVKAAGGIVAAKTNTPEFGAGANTVNAVYGFTGNPFDPQRTCGGSSGGSGVALASGMMPLATGSDLGGSLRTPAAYCGVVGFRPTPGLVPHDVRGHAWNPLPVQGPMGRSVADVALLTAAMVGCHLDDPLSAAVEGAAYLDLPEMDLGDLKVAFSEDLGFAPMDSGIRALFRARRDAVAGLFGRAEDADPPLGDADHTFEVLRAVGFLAGYRALLEQQPDKVGPNVTANVKLGMTFSADDVAQALTAQTQLYRRFVTFMADYDLLIAPVASVPPFAKGTLFASEINGQPLKTYISWMGITFGLTLTVHPVIVLPCGLDHTGMPFGLQLVGRPGAEPRLLAMAQSLERALADIADCQRPRPDIAALSAQAGG